VVLGYSFSAKCVALLGVACVGMFGAASKTEAAEPEKVQFNRDIRPILSDNCYACHGPDAKKRQAELRFDTRPGMFADLDGHFAVVPGKPSESSMLERLTASDPDEKMPPADSGLKITQKQVQLIKRWIEQGASWEDHWSFVRPRRSKLPVVHKKDWPQNAIDYFVLARLERAGLSVSKEAGKTTLLRRVTFDLTGLPPTLKEVDAFLADRSPNAYEKVVDRLLASHRFGEHLAVAWLDAARYADTSGYQNDGPRSMWRWRDWVIDAFNHNQPVRMNSLASQSSKSGWVGCSPCDPKSSVVLTSPTPK